MNHYDFMTKLTQIAPNASDDVDNYGQVIIYTHLKYNDETVLKLTLGRTLISLNELCEKNEKD